jgi:hypothetical protein
MSVLSPGSVAWKMTKEELKYTIKKCRKELNRSNAHAAATVKKLSTAKSRNQVLVNTVEEL